MAAKGRQPTSVRVDAETRERIERVQDELSVEDPSEAHREALKIGLRELEGPLSHRLREIALDAAYHLALVAAVTVIVGFLTTALHPSHAMAIAIVTLAVAVSPPAAVELLRLLRGQSDLSDLFGGVSL